ncbi:MAG: hypothetical protein ABL955_00905 [Elusimicrobiota bacterium]
MKNAEDRIEIQRRKHDLLVEFRGALRELQKHGGKPEFLLYALSAALLAESPEESIKGVNVALKDAIDPDQLQAARRRAETMIRTLGKLAESIRHHDRVRQAADALQAFVDWVAADDLRLLSRPAGHQVGGKVWRYPFYAAMWPHLQIACPKWKEYPMSGWMQQVFDAGDAIKVVDREFVLRSLQTGGLTLKDLRTPAFEISKIKGEGKMDTLRAWVEKAGKTEDITLRGHFSAATNNFFIWRHKLFRRPVDYDQVEIKFTRRDRAYAEAAWSTLRDKLNFAEIPSTPAILLDRCLRSASQ